MQNHLFQILSIVAMNRPKSLSSNDVRDEKVKVLQSIKPLTIDDILLGQYTASLDGKTPGYLQDPTVPKDSVTPTFAAAVFNIDNDEWRGVPFILKCGKALNEQKAEIRIQFHNVAGSLYPNAARNELVIRVQPNEAVYMKFNNKEPGLSNKAVVSELELTYKDRYASNRIPDAYENLIFDVLVGEKSNFVRDDELDAAWKIFTPVLDKIEKERAVKIHEYSFGTRGPIVLDEFIEKAGYTRSLDYKYRL